MSTNPDISLSSIYAWLYFATIVTAVFYGFACMQTLFYYVYYVDDLLYLRIFVIVIWASNTIHTALMVVGTYKYIVAGLANPSPLFWNPELTLQIAPTTLVAVLSQGFLMYRIYVFSGKKIIALLLWFVLSTIQIVSSTIYIAKSLHSINGSLHAIDIVVLDNTIFNTAFALSFSAAAGQDILIAFFLVFLLVRERTDVLASTAHMVQRLTVFAVNTGTWTATFALLSLIFLYVWPSEKLFILFAFPICSIYCNTVLANLNARSYLSRDGSGVRHNLSVDLCASATPFSNRQAKLVFAQPEAVRTTAALVTSSDANVSTILEDDRV